MRNRSLYTLGRELEDGNMYILSVIDLEPAGVLLQAYNQENSQELTMPVSETQVSVELCSVTALSERWLTGFLCSICMCYVDCKSAAAS